MNKQQLASKIWASANSMRSKIEASTYKDFILGFIFYMFLSNKEEQFLIDKVGMTKEDFPEIKEEDDDLVKQCQQNIGYFIKYEHLFSHWLALGKDFTIQNVTEGLSAFNRLISEEYKLIFDKIFSELETGLVKLGDTDAKRSKEVVGLINLIKDIPTDDKQGYDVLGFIYEYLISNFAANAGKKAGEFYTPHEVSLLMAEIVAYHLRENERIEIYDPTSGSGSLLLNIGRAVSKHIANKENIKYYAQELKAPTYNLTRMNLVMRGVMPANIAVRNADTLEEDWPKDERTGQPTLYLDAVVSNPPYSQQWNPKGKELDPRYRDYGVAPKGKADYAFLLHDLYHLKPNGIMTIVLPHGVLFRGDAEGEIRKNLVEGNHIDAIIGLPSDIFFGTGIATIIMVLRQKRDQSDVLFIDASHGFIKSGKKNKLRASDIRRIVDAVNHREELPKFSRLVKRQEIRDNEYNLNIPRYIDSSEPVESFDLYSTMYGDIPNRELEKLNKYWEVLPDLKKQLFAPISATHSRLISKDVKATVEECFAAYKKQYFERMCGMDDFLRTRLIDGLQTVIVNQEEDAICAEIFRCMQGLNLYDPYEAFQLLDEAWTTISADIEILQTEGWDSVRVVEPNMVVKKKKVDGEDKEVEVQEGWKGRIIPYELVQNTLLVSDYMQYMNAKLEVVKATEAIKDAQSDLDEEWQEKLIDEDGEKLLTKELAAAVKMMKKDKELRNDAVMALQTALDDLKAKKKIEKDLGIALADKTRTTIEGLTDEQARELLEDKWITPLCDNLMGLSTQLVDNLSAAVERLAKKYADTLLDVGKDITDAEKELGALLGELTGDEADMAAINELKKLLGGK